MKPRTLPRSVRRPGLRLRFWGRPVTHLPVLLLPALLAAALAVGGCGGLPGGQVEPSPVAPAGGDSAAPTVATAAAGEPGSTDRADPAQAVGGAGDAANDAVGAAAAAAADSGGDAAGDASGTANGATEAAGAAEAAPSLALAAPSELLDSYRIAASYIITSVLADGERRIESTQLQGAWRRTAGPFGYDAAYTLTNISGSRRQTISVVAVGDAVAIQSDGAWSTIAREAALPYGDPDQLLSLPFITRINRGEDLGEETVAGVTVTHYRLTDPQAFAAAVEDLAPGVPGSVRNVLLEGWVADAGYVVKYVLEADLADAQIFDQSGSTAQAQQEVSAAYVLTDLDAVARIEWPADAQPPNTVSVPGFVPNTFPLPEGARVTPRLGMVEIRTDASDADTTAFYRTQLEALGWSVDGELGFYSAEKEGRRIRLTILPDELTGETVVRVFGAEE